jgi:two-component system nitrogen regulation response regulator NtrX
MVQACDSIELLLPGVGEGALRRARTVVQFLRLLTDDAASMRAGAVGVGLDRARGELEHHDLGKVSDALCDLLRHHLRALAGPGSFLWFGEPALAHDEAWRALDELREEMPRLARLPGPGETALEGAARLLASLEELSSPPAFLALWRARVARFAQGPRAAEAIVKARLEQDEGDPSSRSEESAHRALVACAAECLLDRGAVREARDLLTAHAAAAEGDPRLRQLLSWSRLALGDYASSKSAVVGVAPGSAPLPLGLAELRAHKPEWLPCLAGRAPAARLEAPEEPRAAPLAGGRGEIGASVLGVFALRPGGETTAVHLDVAPGLRAAVPGWLEDRDGACSVPTEREHELVVGARAIVVHRESEGPMHGVLGPGSTLALALSPILDAEGEVAGWLHVECEHHLLPDSERLAALARAWGDVVLASRDAPGTREPGPPGGDPSPRQDPPDPLDASAPGEIFRELVAELAIKTAQRRWWGFVHEPGETRLVASGGEAAELAARPEGRGRGLTRAIATRGRVAFEEPDAHLALDPRAGSGTVLPLSAGGRLCGLLAVESIRRRDFGDSEWARHAETSQGFGLALRLARFRAWHRGRHGFDVWFDARRSDFRDFALHLLAAARSRSPVVLSGPAGAGKGVLARWAHFESRFRAGPFRSVECGATAGSAELADRLASAREGSLVLEDVELLDRDGQEALLRFLENGSRGRAAEAERARLLATTRCGLRAAVEEGRMRSDLAHRLDRLQFRVPPLVERREDIPPLVACLTRRFAEEEGLRPPSYDDDALAFLWRQSWSGNVRELESFVYKLVLLGRVDGARRLGSIRAELVREMAGRFSMQLVPRLPSRHPRPGDLIAALRATRMPGGRTNKTRAALYLGWDPDTLVARMKDCGIADEVRDEVVWAVPAQESEEESG